MGVSRTVILFFVAACTDVSRGRAPDSQPVVVELHRVADPAPADRWWGMYNIFFHDVTPAMRDSLRLGASWTGVELAEVAHGDGLATVYGARFKTAGSGKVQYVVDTDGDRDLAEEQPLSFHVLKGADVADVAVEVRSRSGTRRLVPYQVLLADGYSYARIAEYLMGSARLTGHENAVRLRSASADNPFYALDGSTTIHIDQVGDGRIAEQTVADAQGAPAAADEVQPGSPFMLAGRPYELASLDSSGTRLVLRPSAVRVAAVAGFVAPELTTRLLSGAAYPPADDRRRIVLVEFWSVNCPWSERARPALNTLARRLPADRFRWVAVAREADSRVVQRHLETHPMSATVALYDSLTFARYDPEPATPLFYVIDGSGVVRFRALGASTVETVAAEVTRLLDSATVSETRR